MDANTPQTVADTGTSKQSGFDLPLWLGLALILLGLGAGAWFVYGQVADYVAGKPKTFVIKGVNAADYANVRPMPAARVSREGRGPRGMAGVSLGDEVRSIGAAAIRVRAGSLMLNVRGAGDSMTIAGSVLNAAMLHPDYPITQLLKSRVRGNALKGLGLGDEQIRLLSNVAGSPMTYPVRFDAAEVAALKPLLAAWKSAPDSSNQSQSRTLLTAVRKMSSAKVEGAKAAASSQVGAFRASVNDETWAKIREAVTGGQ
jgi:hypothetical protein